MQNIFQNKKIRIISIIIIVVLALGFSFFFFYKQSPEAEAGWWNEDWRYRKKLTIDQTKIDADLADFPVAVVLTVSNFTYSKAQTNGEDIRFTDSNGNTLYYEIEKWNSSATSTIWVKVPVVDDTVSTTLYMYYGNGSATDAQNKTAVWDDDFVMVQHMNNTATGTDSFVDVTKYNNHGTGFDEGGSLQATTAGRIDGAFDFDGNDDHVEVPENSSLSGMNQLTMSGWVNFDQLPTTVGHETMFIVKKHSADPWNSFYFDFVDNVGCSSPNVMYVSIKNQAEGSEYKCANTSLTANQWYHVAATWDGANIHFYLNGVNDDYGDTTFSGTSVFKSDDILYINADDSSGGRINGKIDDVRISKTARPAAWFKAEYYNGMNTLVTQSIEEKGPGPIAYWGFDEGFGTTASDSANANHGTITGATWKDEAECVKGKCLYFDGDADYVTSINNIGITGNSPRTVSIWFKQTVVAEKNIFGFGGNANTELFDIDLTGGDKLIGHFYGAGNDTITGAPTIKANEWNHAVLTYDGTKVDVYLNGQYTNSKTLSLNTSSSQAIIGGGKYAAYNYFQGYIDEVKVYDYARTPDQVKVDYNRGLSLALGGNQYTSLAKGLVMWWQMDEQTWNGTAGEVKDSSGNGNNGTADSAQATSTAKFNRAGNLDGDTDRVNINPAGTNLANLATSSVTMSIWLKTNTVVKSFADISNTGGSTQFLHLVNDHDIVRAYFYLNGDGTQKVLESDSGSISVGQWYHMAVTRDYQTGDTILYLDGVEVDRLQAIGTTGYAPTNIGLGNGSSYCFDGQLDDFRIYNRALSPDEVRRLSEWAPGPVAYWKLDETGGTIAYDSAASSSGSGGNHLTLGYSTFAEPTWEPIGKHGSALNLHGNTQAEAAGIDGTGLSSGFPGKDGNGTNYGMSAMAWVKLRDNTRQDILCRGSGSWCFWVDANSHLTEYATQIFGTTAVPINEWFHMAFTYDGQTAKLYLNGVLDQTKADTEGIPEHGAPFLIGSVGAEDNPDGLVDEAKVYNYARTQRQILEDMHAGRKNNPVAYWNFDEGQGGTAYDSGFLATLGSGRNGTLTSMTTSGPSSAWSINGRSGKALQFDGADDVVTISNSTNLTPYNQSRSVSLWFMAKELGVQQGLMTTGDVAMEDSPLWLIALKSNNVISVYQADYNDGKTVIERNKWYHLVYTYDVFNKTLKLYLNGQLEYIGINEPYNNDSANIFIGGGWDSYFQGSIDEVKIYNYPLTVDEIRQNYNVGQQIILSRSATDNQTDGLLAWWKMDGDLTDASGNGNTGSATGATVTSSAKFGQAYAIGGGTNYISAPTSDSLDSYTDKLTVSGWYYFNTLPNPQSWLFDKGNNYYLRVSSVGGFTNYLVGINNEDYWSTEAGLVTTGRWYYVVFTYDGQERKLYIDGQLKASRKDTGNVNTGGTFNIGNRNSHLEPMDGQVDDIKIYNRALSADEIAQNYADGPKPVAYWKMDDLLGTTAVDSSGNGNTGSLTNGPVWKERGKVGGALQFDGSDDWITLASSTSLADIGATSFSFWVNPQSYTNKAYPTIYNRNGQSETDGYNWLYFDSSGDGSIWYSYANGVSYTELNLETLAPLNTWSHIVLIHDRKSKSITSYKNGVFMETETYADTVLPVVNGAAYIGTYGNSSTNYPFQGQLDDFKIYNYALSPRQIMKEFNGGAPVGYWKMDEGEGVNVKDYSGSGNHGTLVVGSGGIQSVTSSAWTNGLTGKINSSLNFDGIDDRVNLGSVTTGENVTISAWIKTSTSSPEVPIFSNRGSGVYFGIASGKFFIYDNSASPSPGMTSNASVNDNNWHNLIWTSNGSSSIMYIDGEFDSRQAQSRGADTGTAYIAWDASNAVEWFPGQIDEVKIWNYPLTPNEVKNEFNGGFSSFFR